MSISSKVNIVSDGPNKAPKSEPNDRISDLPSKVVERVLGRMPLRDAVRTSILSRRWRYNWTRLPHLILDQDFFRPTKLVLDQQCCRMFRVGNKMDYLDYLDMHLADIVNKLLLQHDGPIHRFVLNLSFYSCRQHDVDRWLGFLSRNGVKELILDGSNQVQDRQTQLQYPKFSSSFFSCSGSLMLLKLTCFTFKPTTSFNGFQYLTSLFFSRVSISTGILDGLLSSATLLENLTLQQCYGVDTININATMLKNLILRECDGVHTMNITTTSLGTLTLQDNNGVNTITINAPNLKYLYANKAFKSITFVNPTSLVVANLSVSQMDPKYRSNFIGFFGSMLRIEKITLAQQAFRSFNAAGIPITLSTKLLHLKMLKLSDIIFAKLDEFLRVLCLIRSSPNLQKLEITSPSFGINGLNLNAAAMKLIEEAKSQGCLLDKLEIVRLESVQDVGPELHLIEFLLASSPKLESMFVKCECNTMEKELRVSRMLMKYSRASPKAKLICSSSILRD